MKKLIILISFSLIFIHSKAQTFEPNFLGNDFQLYKGSLLKLKDDAITGFSFSFYSDIKYCKTDYDNNVVYPDLQYNFNTAKDSLANRVFKVDDIVDNDGVSLKNSSSLDNKIFILKDVTTNQIIYFKYDSENDFNFPFNTSKIVLDEKIFCSKIERSIDDFTGNIKFNSPLFTNLGIASTIIYKEIKNNKTVYFLSLKTSGSTVIVNGIGVTILFTDGTKWVKSSKVDIQAENEGFVYSSFINLTPADLITFSTKKIKKFRLNIFDEEINSSEADKFKIYVKCIKEAK
jgi:hypothetical protein